MLLSCCRLLRGSDVFRCQISCMGEPQTCTDFLNSHPSEYPRPSSCIYSLSTGCILPQFPIPVRDLVSSDGRSLCVLSVMSAFPRTSAGRPRQQRGHGALQDLPRPAPAVQPSPCLVSDGKHQIRFLIISAFFGEPASHRQ